MGKKQIGASIRRQRKKLRISQLQLSLELGYSSNVLYYWENEIKEVPKTAIMLMESKFNFKFNQNV